MTVADGLPEDLVVNTEKDREKDRRQVTREEKILQQKEEHVRCCLLNTACCACFQHAAILCCPAHVFAADHLLIVCRKAE